MPLPTPKSDESQNAFISRCMESDIMQREYDDQNQRIAICYSQWRRSKQSNQMRHIVNKFAPTNIRRTTFNDRIHVVAPVVLMTEGVHHGSAGRILYTAEELSRMPNTWNGRPVPIMHPQDNEGSPVTCNDPEVLESQTVGYVFNVQWESNSNRLKGELWIDEEKARQVCSSLNLPDVVDMIDRGDQVEVSTGLFPEESGEGGVWNGQEYDASAVNIHSDHLALLPVGEGACSWQDGCGVRNQNGDMPMRRTKFSSKRQKINNELVINELSYSGTESSDWSAPNLEDFDVSAYRWSDLNQSERANVAAHFLIGSSRADDFGELKFPVVNPSSGKLNEYALRAVISGRGAQVEGVSADERAAARRRAYNLLNEEFDAELEVPENLESIEPEQQNNEGGIDMHENKNCSPEKVEAVINSPANGFTEQDRGALQQLREEIIDKIPTEELKASEPVQNQEMDFETLFQNANSETRQILEHMRNLYRQERNELVQCVLNNSSNWTQQELDNLDLEFLKKVANDNRVVNYKGASGASSTGEEKELEEGIGMPWLQSAVQ